MLKADQTPDAGVFAGDVIDDEITHIAVIVAAVVARSE